MQRHYGISCCVLLSEMNNRGIPVACEVDVGSAVTMCALRHASGVPATCLDWNNNYGNDDNKCILFHCGPVPQSMMTCTGVITDHAILANEVGKGCAYGCNSGRIKPTPFSFGNLITEKGKMKFYLGEGRFTDDPIPEDFFGCAGVAEFPDLQESLLTIGLEGHRHHTAVTAGLVAAPVAEAFERYLGYKVTRV
jgi:L-fucose isomerase-like protein